MELTLICPYYRNPLMLRRQVQEWNHYPKDIRIICVDDGSPEPALPVIQSAAAPRLMERLELYRIMQDIPWNRGGARNLGAKMAKTDWIVQVDIDHLLPIDAAAALSYFEPNPGNWYRFHRWRRGKADETRQKDALPDECEYGMIHPHVDSYLVQNAAYWRADGYDERFSGAIGGGNLFLKDLAHIQGPPVMLPLPIRLEVYTRNAIPDANDTTLPRGKTGYWKRRRELEEAGSPRPGQKDWLCFTWNRVELTHLESDALSECHRGV